MIDLENGAGAEKLNIRTYLPTLKKNKSQPELKLLYYRTTLPFQYRRATENVDSATKLWSNRPIVGISGYILARNPLLVTYANIDVTKNPT